MGAAHPACPQCHGAAHLAVVRVEKHACVLPRERFNVCATPCVHMHTHTDTRLQPLWRNSPAVGGPAPGGDARGFPFSSRGGSSLRVPGPRPKEQRLQHAPPSQLGGSGRSATQWGHSAALRLCSLPVSERERSPARPSPPPLPWGAMSHPPHLPAPTLPLALGHTCLLPRRTVLIWGTVGASLKGETLSRPALCCRLKSQQNTQHWWHPWGLLHVLPGRATIFPRGAFLGRRQASTPAPRTVFLHSWAVTAPRCGRLCSARCVWSWTDTAGRAGAGGNRSTCIHQQELC